MAEVPTGKMLHLRWSGGHWTMQCPITAAGLCWHGSGWHHHSRRPGQCQGF